MDEYFALPKGTGARTDYRNANPVIGDVLDQYYAIQDIVRETYPQFEYLNNLYQEAGSDARREYLEGHPDLQKGWGLMDKYENEWMQIDPDYQAHSDAYYDMPPSPRSMYLDAYPELQEAWGLEDVYIEQHPELNDWINQENTQERYAATQDVMESIPSLAYNSVLKYFALDAPLSAAAREALEWEWEKRGKPYADFQQWLDSMRYYFQP